MGNVLAASFVCTLVPTALPVVHGLHCVASLSSRACQAPSHSPPATLFTVSL